MRSCGIFELPERFPVHHVGDILLPPSSCRSPGWTLCPPRGKSILPAPDDLGLAARSCAHLVGDLAKDFEYYHINEPIESQYCKIRSFAFASSSTHMHATDGPCGHRVAGPVHVGWRSIRSACDQMMRPPRG